MSLFHTLPQHPWETLDRLIGWSSSPNPAFLVERNLGPAVLICAQQSKPAPGSPRPNVAGGPGAQRENQKVTSKKLKQNCLSSLNLLEETLPCCSLLLLTLLLCWRWRGDATRCDAAHKDRIGAGATSKTLAVNMSGKKTMLGAKTPNGLCLMWW